jgi:hypothetical protein
LSKQAALRQITSPLVAIAAVVFFGVASQSAYAHWPIVSAATAGCSNTNPSVPVINWTVISWDPGGGGGQGDNQNVIVLFNGVQPPGAMGAFTPLNGDMFSGVSNAPSGVTTVIVSAEAIAPWGDGFHGDDFAPTDAQITVTLPASCAPPGNGRFTGGGKVVVSNAVVPASGDVTVTKGFEVECDLNPAHENLELNWTGGNHFHMDLIKSAGCTLTGLPPNPPNADVNRIDATGIGSYNGMEGYTVVFTLWDQGEPGTFDEAGFVVCLTDPANPNSCSTSTNVVLSVPLQLVTTGNIQAHFDQGH